MQRILFTRNGSSRATRQSGLRTLGIIVLVLLTAVALAQPVSAKGKEEAKGNGAAKVALYDVDGNQVGKMKLIQKKDVVQVRVEAYNLTPGFHGFHIHAVGQCSPDFTAAGGHFNPTGVDHGEHAGDMPVLLVTQEGTAEMRFITDRFNLADLFDEDGSAVIIHAGANNYANIPDRYTSTDSSDPGPDDATLAAGDSGARVACGVIE